MVLVVSCEARVHVRLHGPVQAASGTDENIWAPRRVSGQNGQNVKSFGCSARRLESLENPAASVEVDETDLALPFDSDPALALVSVSSLHRLSPMSRLDGDHGTGGRGKLGRPVGAVSGTLLLDSQRRQQRSLPGEPIRAGTVVPRSCRLRGHHVTPSASLGKAWIACQVEGVDSWIPGTLSASVCICVPLLFAFAASPRRHFPRAPQSLVPDSGGSPDYSPSVRCGIVSNQCVTSLALPRQICNLSRI